MSVSLRFGNSQGLHGLLALPYQTGHKHKYWIEPRSRQHPGEKPQSSYWKIAQELRDFRKPTSHEHWTRVGQSEGPGLAATNCISLTKSCRQHFFSHVTFGFQDGLDDLLNIQLFFLGQLPLRRTRWPEIDTAKF